MKFVAPGMVCLCLAFGAAACARSEPTVMVCDPVCSPRPVNQVNQDLRRVDEDDGRMAALEAAAARDPRAAHDLALRFFRGDGVPRDNHQALSWMRVAAEKGDLGAQKALGRIYLTGLGEVGHDPNEAHAWLWLAASRGDRESQQLLAEAEAAKRSNQEEFKRLNRWNSEAYNGWRWTDPYYCTWNGQSWNY